MKSVGVRDKKEGVDPGEQGDAGEQGDGGAFTEDLRERKALA